MKFRSAPARWPLLSAREMRALEAHSVAHDGVSYAQLMERAGEAVAAVALALLAERYGPVWVACGPGHNGGDGLAAARLLHERRVPVKIWPLRAPSEFRGLAAGQWRRAREAGVPAHEAGARVEWSQPALIVDALFGTGTTPKHSARAQTQPSGAHIEKINAARSAGARVLAVDLPTGVLADTGQFSHEPVRATHTLALGFPKLGHAIEPGRAACGRIRVARLGISGPQTGASPARLLNPARAPHEIPARAPHMHKGDAGHVLVVAGSTGKTGAAALVARGALRAGAGLVTLACRASIHSILEVKCTEAMTLPLPENEARALDIDAALRVLENFQAADALVIGPGLGQDAPTFDFVRALLARRRGARVVLDADALHAFARAPEQLAHETFSNIILTPHPGEAAALLGVTARDVNADRAGAARELARRTRCCVVLKGSCTAIAHAGEDARAQQPQTALAINATGNPLLAAGGSGDVLAGVLGALLAQRLHALPVANAAELGVWLHGAAADRLSRRMGFTGALASEIADELPLALKEAAARAAGARNSRDNESSQAPALNQLDRLNQPGTCDVVDFP